MAFDQSAASGLLELLRGTDAGKVMRQLLQVALQRASARRSRGGELVPGLVGHVPNGDRSGNSIIMLLVPRNS